MSLIAIAVAAVLIVYILLVLLMSAGWLRALKPAIVTMQVHHPVSVIVAVRNEAQGIIILLQQLARQSYTSFEVIVVDDHSTDGTTDLVKSFIKTDLRFHLLKNNGTGKKRAITTGVEAAAGVVIVTTDGDCEVNENWLAHINGYFQDDKIKMVFGGVALRNDHTLFSKMQVIEFASLIGSGAALHAFGYPVMCNGANLAFRKDAFRAVNGYEDNFNVASGDDEFLMRKIILRSPSSLAFMRDESTIVSTTTSTTFEKFIQQRLRWAGKWRHNQSYMAKGMAMLIWLVQLCLVLAFILLVVDPGSRMVLGFLLMIRFFVEAWFLYPVSGFLKVSWNWTAYLLLQVVYPVYVVFIGLFSNFMPVNWKERPITP